MVRTSRGVSAARARRRAVFIKTTKRRSSVMTTGPCPSSSWMPRQPKRQTPQSNDKIDPGNQNQDSADSGSVDEEFFRNELDDNITMTASMFTVPALFTQAPPVRDALVTDTTEAQDATVALCLPFLVGDGPETPMPVPLTYNDRGVARLDRARHVRFLKTSLKTLPGAFVPYDASRPWLLFWCLNGLSLLGEDVTQYRMALAATAQSMQNASGGFGGGHMQASHLATTYAVVMALALVGGEKCYEVIDRRALWRWLCSLKQPNGGFQISKGGEQDVRAAYCAATIISILDLPLGLTTDSPAWTPENPTLFTGLAKYVQRCQTYEGGFSAQPESEAHGGYAFCALACLSIIDSPDRSFPRYLDIPRLVSWLSSRQYAPEGGFSGRTNKLVDGCYSHWVGDCWPLVEACLAGPRASADTSTANGSPATVSPPQSLFNREGLIRYILCCCQDQTKRGGLRDKPEKMSDSYHTCYVLSGLSSAQHKWELVDDSSAAPEEPPSRLMWGRAWKVSPFIDAGGGVQVFDEEDRVNAVHPVYTIAADRVEQIRSFFWAKGGF